MGNLNQTKTNSKEPDTLHRLGKWSTGRRNRCVGRERNFVWEGGGNSYNWLGKPAKVVKGKKRGGGGAGGGGVGGLGGKRAYPAGPQTEWEKPFTSGL